MGYINSKMHILQIHLILVEASIFDLSVSLVSPEALPENEHIQLGPGNKEGQFGPLRLAYIMVGDVNQKLFIPGNK